MKLYALYSRFYKFCYSVCSRVKCLSEIFLSDFAEPSESETSNERLRARLRLYSIIASALVCSKFDFRVHRCYSWGGKVE